MRGCLLGPLTLQRSETAWGGTDAEPLLHGGAVATGSYLFFKCDGCQKPKKKQIEAARAQAMGQPQQQDDGGGPAQPSTSQQPPPPESKKRKRKSTVLTLTKKKTSLVLKVGAKQLLKGELVAAGGIAAAPLGKSAVLNVASTAE